MKRKMSWRSLKFIPEGGDESQAITRKDKGFMHLCDLYRNHIHNFRGYGLDDTKGMFKKYGYNNVDINWSDFRKALIKFSMEAPPQKPSVFCGEKSPSDHNIRMRKRILAATLREYISPSCLAEDLLEWMSRGREEDIRKFMIHLLFGVGWLKEPPRTPEAASAKPIERPDGMTLIMR
jgi:hypothetical protein